MANSTMANATYEIDPNADAVLILKHPNASFASWSLGAVEDNTEASPVEGDAGTNTFGPAIAPTTLVDHCTSEEEIRYRVSSRHLMLASPVLNYMLSGEKWKEGTPDEIRGLYCIPAEDWDAEALLILLDVIHHRNRQVPRTVSLEMLAKLAVLIDYYGCAEALEPFTEMWVDHLKATSPVPSQLCRNLLLWMCIAWVLKLPHEFSQTTTVAIRRDSEDLPTLGLPIVTCITRIEEARTEAIRTVFLRLQELVEEYRSPLYQCPSGDSFECGSILYGALTKEMELHGLSPNSIAPFSGWSISELYNKLQQIQSPSWSSKSRKQKHPCDLRGRVMAIVDPATRLANGPRLEDFESI